jgi:hypothetical protein
LITNVEEEEKVVLGTGGGGTGEREGVPVFTPPVEVYSILYYEGQR